MNGNRFLNAINDVFLNSKCYLSYDIEAIFNNIDSSHKLNIHSVLSI